MATGHRSNVSGHAATHPTRTGWATLFRAALSPRIRVMRLDITEPFLPPMEEYRALLDQVWERNRFTNDGPFVRELEACLSAYLGVEHVLLVANGTLALQLAVRALGMSEDVITTAFSHIATTSSLQWEGCRVRFADIDADSWNIDPEQVRRVWTEQTTGVVATHVYGNPCAIEAIESIGEETGAKILFDAAHCFGSSFEGRSALSYGDASTISFHATKPFHTIEGGAVVTRSAELHQRLVRMRNFGHDGPAKFSGVGINAKMSEVHAAMGLVNLEYADRILEKRAHDCGIYDDRLRQLGLGRPRVVKGATSNSAYYPVLFGSEGELLATVRALEAREMFPRRYFFPSLSQLEYLRPQAVPIAEDVASRVLCLPLSYQITEDQIDSVCETVRRSQRGRGVCSP
jgi:dTDP-4-amino-4,6-dideoxygalactose transaminase